MIDKSLDLMGFSKGAKNSIYKILAVILNIGNIQINETNGNLCVSDTSKKFVDNVAALTNIKSFDLEQSIFMRTIKDARATDTEIR